MKIITTAIIKGGTGKTTTAAALAQAANKRGKRVLCVDMDPQANLSFLVGAEQREQAGAFQLINGSDPGETIQHTAQGLDVITATRDLAAEQTRPGSAKRLQEALAPLKRRYDYIIIDTPPQMGELTFNALQACTYLLIPLEADNSSLQGLYQITDIAEQIRKTNKGLKSAGAIITRYDSRPKLNRYMQEVIADKGKEVGAPFLVGIRPGIAIKEAQALQKSLFEYAPKSKPAQDYMKLFEILEGMK